MSASSVTPGRVQPSGFTPPPRKAGDPTPDHRALTDQQRPPKALRRALWTTVICLTAVGVAGAALRMSIVATTLMIPVSQRPPLSEHDQLNMRIVAAGLAMKPGTDKYARTEAEVVRFANGYTAHPVYAFMHLALGSLILLLAPFQFSRRVRARHIQFHRWSGRTILLASVAIAISAYYFGIVRSTIHPSERPTIAIILALFVFAAVRAYRAIRRRDVAQHREWMIRTYAFLIGIASVRVVSFALTPFFRGGELGVAVITSWWIGWLLTLFAAELWIRYTRRRGVVGVPLHERTPQPAA
jgi:uncharacterized membrane protein